MLELVQRLVDQGLIQFSETIQGHADIGIDHTNQGGGISALASAHIAVILHCQGKHLLNNLVLLVVPAEHGLVPFTLLGSKPQRKLETIERRVLLRKSKKGFDDFAQSRGEVAFIDSRFLNLEVQPLEMFREQRYEQTMLAAEIVVQRGLGDPRCIHNFLHANCVIALIGKQLQRASQNPGTVIHTRHYTERYNKCQEQILMMLVLFRGIRFGFGFVNRPIRMVGRGIERVQL